MSGLGGDILEWVMDHVMPWLIVGVIAAVVFGIPLLGYAAWRESKDPQVHLNKKHWACTNMQRIPITTYVKSGNVMVPMTTYSNECHEWTRQP